MNALSLSGLGSLIFSEQENIPNWLFRDPGPLVLETFKKAVKTFLLWSSINYFMAILYFNISIERKVQQFFNFYLTK